ncbi:MAG TPA: hypothetical protein VGC41_02705, partial [Kofleriaceae bacterium]
IALSPFVTARAWNSSTVSLSLFGQINTPSTSGGKVTHYTPYGTYAEFRNANGATALAPTYWESTGVAMSGTAYASCGVLSGVDVVENAPTRPQFRVIARYAW